MPDVTQTALACGPVVRYGTCETIQDVKSFKATAGGITDGEPSF